MKLKHVTFMSLDSPTFQNCGESKEICNKLFNKLRKMNKT